MIDLHRVLTTDGAAAVLAVTIEVSELLAAKVAKAPEKSFKLFMLVSIAPRFACSSLSAACWD